MATVTTRYRADGTATYRVVWKAGGGRDGVWESETFLARSDAGRFRRDVDLAGQLWPEGWVKGVGYAAPTRIEPPAPSFVEFGQGYVRDLTGITPATRHRYDRQVLLVTEQLRGVLHAEPTVANIEQTHVRRWVNARESTGARPKTIANYHWLLFMVLASACRSAPPATGRSAGGSPASRCARACTTARPTTCGPRSRPASRHMVAADSSACRRIPASAEPSAAGPGAPRVTTSRSSG